VPIDRTNVAALPVATDEEVFFFGPPDRQLFGCFHPPGTDVARDSAVLLCYPWGQEYLASHRAYLQLAVGLASRGYAVLRFDYAGTGDSGGTSDSCSLTTWRVDVNVAAAELRQRAGVDLVCLGGLRLGGSVAALAAAAERDISGLFLWQPVVRGTDYLDDIAARHKAMLWRSFATLPTSDASSGALYRLGFPLSNALFTDLKNLDVETLALPGCPVLIVNNEEDAASLSLRDVLHSQGARVDHEIVPSFAIWHEDVDKGLVPRQTIDRIADWLEAHCP
jgi:pimeloyl-ACP methyl ester carboxylesterase